MKSLKYIAAVIIIVSITVQISSATIEGVFFENAVKKQSTVLKVRGTALLIYLYTIKAYVGALYLKKEVSSSQALSNTPKMLVLSYFHSIKATDFSKATTKMIKKNITPGQYALLKPEIDIFNSWYRDVEPGDKYSITYLPGRGTTLSLNNNILGTMKGELFSQALFSIWIGKNPIDNSFKNKLLGL